MAVAATLVAAAASPAGAVAIAYRQDRTRSVNVNPPGENGFVSVDQYAQHPNAHYDERKPNDGYPVPHFADQIDDYWKATPAERIFPHYKSAHFYRPNHPGPHDSKEVLANGAIIYRDHRRGIPRIFAPNEHALFYAVGVAQAEDRMTQAEIFRRAALGRLAEILGPDYAAYDYERRRDTYSSKEWTAALNKLSPEERQILQDFSDGFNFVLLKDIATDHAPAELVALGDWPPHTANSNGPIPGPWLWSPVDSYAIASLMVQAFGDEGGNELQHLALACWLQSKYPKAKAHRIFLDRLWTRDSLSPSSVPGRGHLRPQRWFVPKAQAAADGCRKNRGAVGAARADARAQALVRAVTDRLNLPRFGSNAIAIGRPKSATGNTFLYGAPQVGYALPSLFVEQEWHARGWQVLGLGFAGLPAIPIGHGPNFAWTTTSGQTDMVDTYVSILDPDKQSSWYRGHWVPVDRRAEYIVVGHGPPSAGAASRLEGPLPASDLPQGCPPTCTVVRIVHHSRIRDRYIGHRVLMPVYAYGPKVPCPGHSGRKGCHIAYAKRKAWYGREAGTINGFLNVDRLGALANRQRVSRLHEFETLTSRIVSSHNLVYADNRGNIGYWLGGSYPLRPRRVLTQLPLSAGGREEWGRNGSTFLKFKRQPHSVNPKRGWVDSWNNKPSNGRSFASLDTGDGTRWGLQHHVEAITDYLRATGRLGFQGVARAGYRAAFNDTRTKWVMPILLRALSTRGIQNMCGSRIRVSCDLGWRFPAARRALMRWYRGDNPIKGGAERTWFRGIPKPWWAKHKPWPFDTGGQALWDAWWNVGMEAMFHRWFRGAPADYPGPSGDSMENGEDPFFIHALLGPWRARLMGTLAPRIDYLSPSGRFPKSARAFGSEVDRWVARTMSESLVWLAHPDDPPLFMSPGARLPDPGCCAPSKPIRAWREDQRVTGDMNCFNPVSVYSVPCMPAEDKGTYAQIVEIFRR